MISRMVVSCIFTFVGIYSYGDEAAALLPSAGKLNFFSCQTNAVQDIKRILSENSQAILTEVIGANQCQLITNLEFETVEEFMQAEDTQEVLQSIEAETHNDANDLSKVLQISEFHLNHEQFVFLLNLAKQSRSQPVKTVLIFFFSTDAEVVSMQQTADDPLFIHYYIQKASLFIDRQQHSIEYDPANK